MRTRAFVDNRRSQYWDIYKNDKLCYNIAVMSSRYDKYMKRLNIPNHNREAFALSLLLLFSIFSRVIPFFLITILFVMCFLALLAVDFYFYVNKSAKDENKNEKTIEFSWGFVKERTELMDMDTIIKYLKNKDFSFYKTYLNLNINKGTVLLFFLGDILVAFKNLDLAHAGIYIAMSLFTKFVFLGYLFMRQSYAKVLIGEKNTEENTLDIFYSLINNMFSIFAVLFIFFFVLSRYLVQIFFGNDYLPFQSSLPFVLLANIGLVIAICIYSTSKRIDSQTTGKIAKAYLFFFILLFVFMGINYLDTIAYFVIGSSALISIFLYNLVIKKPEYIKSTYNHLF